MKTATFNRVRIHTLLFGFTIYFLSWDELVENRSNLKLAKIDHYFIGLEHKNWSRSWFKPFGICRTRAKAWDLKRKQFYKILFVSYCSTKKNWGKNWKLLTLLKKIMYKYTNIPKKVWGGNWWTNKFETIKNRLYGFKNRKLFKTLVNEPTVTVDRAIFNLFLLPGPPKLLSFWVEYLMCR